MQREDLARELIYDALAQLLPTMGRDFVVDIKIGPHDNAQVSTSVSIVPLTPLGAAILPHIKQNLTPTMQRLAQERGMANDQSESSREPDPADIYRVPDAETGAGEGGT